MGNKFDCDVDPNKEYDCSPVTKSTKFTKLMLLINNTVSFDYLENYIKTNIDTINKTNEKGWTALMIASANSKTFSSETTVKLLLANKADPNIKNNLGSTALISAVKYPNASSENTIALLLANKANPNIKDNDGLTALMIHTALLMPASYSIIKLLLDNKADPNMTDKYGNTALIFACYVTKESVVEQLLANKADPNLRNNDGQTALIMLTSYSIVKLLLDNKADPNMTDKNGNTALILACCETKNLIVEQLLANKADLNLRNNDGLTALSFAIRYDNLENSLTKQLLANKADPNLRNNNGFTSLMIALKYSKTVELLLVNNADPNLKRNCGSTALMMAAEFYGYHDSAKILLDYKANIHLKNNAGRTALEIAAKCINTTGCEKNVLLLLDYKADPNFGPDDSILNYAKNIDIVDRACRNGLVITFNMAISAVNSKLLNKYRNNILKYEIDRDKYKNMVKSINNDYVIHFKNKPGSFSSKLAELNYGLTLCTIDTTIIMNDKLLVYLLSINSVDDIQNKFNLFLRN